MPQRSQTYGFSPVCWRTWAMRELAWVKAFPQIKHWHGFSPAGEKGNVCVDEQPGVGDHMGSQNPLGKEQSCVPTSVDADVSLQCPGVGKLTLAVDTDVGFLPAVDSEVPFQVA